VSAAAPLPDPDTGADPADEVFCELCQRAFAYESLGEEGACPSCGTLLVEPRKLPWHFRFLLAGSAIYLLWRLGQGLDWLARYLGRHL